MDYAIVDAATRKVRRRGSCMDSDAPSIPVAGDEKLFAVTLPHLNFTIDQNGVVAVIVPMPMPVGEQDVDVERDRRIDAGFAFMGKTIQSRPEDRENIAGAKSAAMDALVLGAQSGDLAWQKLLTSTGADRFAWITMDNSMLDLDAQQTIQMGYAAMVHKQRLIFAAKALKDAIANGAVYLDVTGDALWP